MNVFRNKSAIILSSIFQLASILSPVNPFASLQACPLCDSLANTISDDLDEAQTVVLAQVIGEEPQVHEAGPRHLRFEISHLLKSNNARLLNIESVDSPTRIQSVYANDALPRKQTCLLMSYTPDDLQWTLPMALSLEATDYVRGMFRTREHEERRLEYFLPYLASSDKLIADDAYNEFATRPMSHIAQIRKHLERDIYVEMLRSPTTKPRLRSLLWMLLSLCGKPSDSLLFEESIASKCLRTESIDIDLAASIAFYIVQGGEGSLRKIERDFLRDPAVSTSNTHAAISAIRVVGQEFDTYSRHRLSRALRLALNRPDIADFVIPDLARWEDWTAFDQLEQLFFDADADSSFVRIPIINYMQLCPHPNAASVLQRMEQADPNAARRAAMISGRFQRSVRP